VSDVGFVVLGRRDMDMVDRALEIGSREGESDRFSLLSTRSSWMRGEERIEVMLKGAVAMYQALKDVV
jgi:hypothetical protein